MPEFPSLRTALASRPIGLALVTGLAALFPAGAARAQTLEKDIWINVQAYYPRVDTDAQVTANVDAQPGSEIDMETDLALDRKEVLPAVSAGFRTGHFIIAADYFRLKRTGSVDLAREIVFDDTTYAANAHVESGFSSDIYRLTVGYAVIQQDGLEISLGLGLHATRFVASISGEGQINDASAQLEVRRKKVFAPLPTLGIAGTYRIAPGLELNGRFDYFKLKIDAYDGKLLNAQIGANYFITPNVSLGAAYRIVDYKLGIDKTSWSGEVRYVLKGPALVLQAAF